MNKQSTDIEQKIETLSNIFVTKILGNVCQKGKCFTTCYPLSVHLENNNIQTSIVMGEYKGQIHYWLTLDETTIIIDPTIKQFDKTQPQIFVGLDKANDYKGNVLEDQESVVYWWKRPFINSEFDDEDVFVPKDYDRKSALEIILKAATLLYVENKQMSKDASYTLSKRAYIYVTNILQILKTDKNKYLIDELKSVLPSEFNSLLTWALNIQLRN
jgi:hypothetical protein